jgi:hypothetical protein
MTKHTYENIYGTPTIEYHFESTGAWIEKRGSKMAYIKNKPYSVRYGNLGKNFKTLNECLEYILTGDYVFENEMVKKASKDISFHYDVNPIN